MPITTERNELAQTICLSECVDISEAAGLKSALEIALASEQGIHVKVSALDSLDVTAIQLLWAANCQAAAAGREFWIEGPWNSEIESRLREAGISLSSVLPIAQAVTGGTNARE